MVAGTVVPGWEPLAETLDRVVAADGRGGAALCVYHRGGPVVDVWTGAADAAGTPWHEDSLAMSFSTTKGVTATALHLCVDRGLLDYDDPVAQHWPAFGSHGKEAITVRQVLCHEAGLYDLSSIVSTPEQLLDWDAMIRAIEGMTPAYPPGSENAYHGVTFGYLVGELVRRVSGTGIRELVQRELVAPLGLDGLFVGTPAAEHHRVVELLGPDGAAGTDPEALVALAAQMGLTVRPELVLAALPPFVFEIGQGPRWLEAPIPAGNGCFTARSLARMYACLAAGGELDGVRLLSAATLERATAVQNTRPDLVIVFPMHWRLGYHGVMTTAGVLERAFGHNGFGGSGAWADPERQLAIAYTLNALGSAIAGDARFMELGGVAVRLAAETSAPTAPQGTIR